jgi:hypothetical protein
LNHASTLKYGVRSIHINKFIIECIIIVTIIIG